MPKNDEAEELDVGPLTRTQLRSLARDQISALRATATALWEEQKIACDLHLLDRLEYQLCRPGKEDGR